MVSEPTVLLAHDVGAGKTATMAMGACELRRLGLVRKPAIIVPNHMLDQFAREFHQLYPQAKVLVADKDDRTAEGRKSFVARCATGDWDAVIMTGSAFQQIPVSDETRARFQSQRAAALRQAINESTEGLTVKRLEAAIARAEQNQARLLAAPKKDDGVTFEMTGIDYLQIDLSSHPMGVRLVRSGARRALWDTPARSLRTPHSRHDHQRGRRPAAAVGRSAGAAGEPSRRAALLGRARRHHGLRPRPGRAVPGALR